jgi:hypothetical protein
VSFEVEPAFQGLVDRLDPLADADEVAEPAGLLVLAVRGQADQFGVGQSFRPSRLGLACRDDVKGCRGLSSQTTIDSHAPFFWSTATPLTGQS